MYKVLCIGNSFSEDSTRYLYQLGQENNDWFKTVNLYIGGCPIRAHYFNILEDARKYELQYNGMNTKFFVTIKEALMSDEWDIVTIQQVSHLARDFATYEPYLKEIADFVRKYAPQAKLYMHETWSYEEGSDRLTKELGYTNGAEMLADLKSAYEKAADCVKADGIIPFGQVMYRLHQNGIEKVHRDTFHANLGVGRYALALTWFKYFTKKDVSDIDLSSFEIEVTPDEIEIAKRTVNEIVK